ncbi:MAG: YebC/PmpR family DNA-binding transcriptional regulator [bacterium]
MSGHSRWSTIRRKKSAADAKRGREFSKLIRLITIAAREGGGDINANMRLRTAVEAARAANMPQDNITRAIKRGTGELEGVSYEAYTYEGYGPGGTAILIETLTDNKNRTTAEIRHIMSKQGGSLGESGCVQWMFEKKGVILVNRADAGEDALMEIGIENGADEVAEDGNYFRIVSHPSAFDKLRKAVEDAGIRVENAEISMEAQTQIRLAGKEAEAILRIVNALEEHDDVQNVWSNFDIPDDVMEKLAV